MVIYQMLNLRFNICMNMHEHRRARLLSLIATHHAGSRKKFCDDSGLSESRLAQLLSPTYRDGQGFGEKAARTLEQILHLDEFYFDFYAADAANAEHSKHVAITASAGSQYIEIQRVKLKLQAGKPDFSTTPVKSAGQLISFHQDWFRAHAYIPEKLLATTVSGNSMEPTISDDDQVIFNTGDTELRDGALFVINCAAATEVRRLIRDCGQWFMSADNPDQKYYQRQDFNAETDIVIGRVILIQRENL